MRSTVVVPLVAAEGRRPSRCADGRVAAQHRFDEQDVLGLEVIAGIAGGIIAKTELLVVLRRTAARYRTLVEHLPGHRGDGLRPELRLLVVAGPGARLWRYAERNVVPGQSLRDIVSAAELAILEPFYRAALGEPARSNTTRPTPVSTSISLPCRSRTSTATIDQLLVTVTDVTQAEGRRRGAPRGREPLPHRLRGGTGRHGPDGVERSSSRPSTRRCAT